MVWQVHEARQRLSDVIRLAESDGPQTITRHGEAIAVVVPVATWRRRDGDVFKQLLRGAPPSELPPIRRDRTTARPIEL